MKPNWFIAYRVDPGAWYARVPPPPRNIRPFHPDDLHMTVAFLGAVSPSDADNAWKALPTLPSVRAVLDGVVPMGNPRRYSALSAVVGEGRETLEGPMAHARDVALAAAGCAPEKRRMKAHVTVARPMRRASEADRAAGLAWARALRLDATVSIGQVALYTWSEDRKARLFRVVSTR